ncbi:Protein MAIN-LIKE 1 [Glycine soja]
MVKIKGICRTLSRVIERALRSEVSSDADETHQRQRPIASVHRQRTAALVAEDVEHVDHAADEVHDQPREAVVDNVVVDAQGFSGRPHKILVLMDYIHHVERLGLKLSSYGKKVQKFGRFAPEIEGIVTVTGLSPLIAYSLDTGRKGIISVFAERWHKETSSFHLPIGEVTITLDDVASLLHLPIIGVFHSFEDLHVD